MEDSDGWETAGRGVQWVIIGDPTVRRHVYAERLAKLLHVPYISMGSLVRQELNPTSPIYKQIAGAVNKGKLVPEDVIFGLLSKRFEDGYNKGENGFILDGIPRTRMQAEILDQIAEIDLVLNLKFAEESLSKNMSGNGIYSSAREFRSVATSGFNVTAEQRKPLEEYYRKQKKLLDFQVSGGSGDGWQGLLAALQLQHMNAVMSSNSSHKLTA